MTTILGISISHDGTLSLLRDGAHVFSVAEERLSRNKGHIGFPFQALAHVFETGLVAPDAVDCVAVAIDQFRQGSNRILEFEMADDVPYYDIMNSPAPEGFAFRQRRFDRAQLPDAVRAAFLDRLREILDGHGCSAPVELVDHHSCHAASVAYACTLDDPLVVTLDGEGDGLSGSVSVLEAGDRLRRLHAVSDRDSLGNIYSHVTRQLGYKIARHEGKITGLAAFGDPAKGLPLLWQAVSVTEGEISIRGGAGTIAALSLADSLRRGRPHLYRPRPRKVAQRIAHLSPEDQAAAVQTFLEEAVCAYVDHWLKATGKRNVALAGGVFANVKLNQRVAALSPVEGVFVFPNMGDGGNAVGAALIAHERLTGSPPPRTDLPNAYLGPAPERAQIEAALAASPVPLRIEEPADLPGTVARAIHAGKIVGWFQGRMEFGPRALGARSILADPTRPEMKDLLNTYVKHREEFRPFAPAVLEECAPEFFPGCERSPFMLFVYPVAPDKRERVPAITHVDGTARVQTVSRESHKRFYALIQAFERRRGVPMVLNTSFNVMGEPIVNTPEDAVRCYCATGIDALVLGDYVLTKD